MTALALSRLFELTPLIFLLGFAVSRVRDDERWVWRNVERLALTALGFSLVSLVTCLLRSDIGGHATDRVGAIMMSMVTLLAWMITRFSRRYLAGDPGQLRYVANLTLALTSVSAVVAAQHFGLLVVAWIASSFCLHGLLLFYPERMAAENAAYKKFVFSRIAEALLLVAAALIYWSGGSLFLADIGLHAQQHAGSAPAMQIAMLLIAFAVILKSAQLPVHGWLIQVMEAPTPVSALLHAGVVNLGGFVLIRLAGPLAHAEVARDVLVFVGSTTAVLAALVMMTRISIKVRLAWSTCAQMGFLLMECGLGLYDLALLHLVAHSLYKAYTFLSAGDTVLDAGHRQMLGQATESDRPPHWGRFLWPIPVCVGIVWLSVQIWQWMDSSFQLDPVVLLILAFALAPVLWPRNARSFAADLVLWLRVAGVAQLYLLWHHVFGALAPTLASTLAPTLADPFPTLAGAWVITAFALLYVAQAWLRFDPESGLSRRMYPWVYAGFFLDEYCTRLISMPWLRYSGWWGTNGLSSTRAVAVSGDRS